MDAHEWFDLLSPASLQLGITTPELPTRREIVVLLHVGKHTVLGLSN